MQTSTELDIKLSQKYHFLTPEQKIEFINSLSPAAFNQFRYYSNAFLRPSQIVPEGDWRYFIAQCGRGWGKSKMGAHWLASKVYQGVKGLALVAPTHSDIEDYIKEALEAEFPPDKKPRYIAGDKKKFVCFNGIEIKAYSSDKEIRGSNLSYIWLDEFCAWCDRNEEKATDRFKVLNYAVRKSKAQFVITTTPRPWKILKTWNKRFQDGDPAVKFVYGAMEENTALSQTAKNELYNEYSGTRLGRQELYADLLTDVEGALWNQDMIDGCRIHSMADIAPDFNIDDFDKIIIAVDPAITSNEHSDSTGIIVVGLYKGNCYVLADLSGTYTPNQWANKVNQAYKQYKANYIIVEVNQGGDLVRANLKSVNPFLPIKDVRATKGKLLRAEPIAALYEQNKVHHIGNFSQLEQQMTSFTGDQKSPDRLDALVYAISSIMLSSTYGYRGGTGNIGMAY